MTALYSVIGQVRQGKLKRAYWLCGDRFLRDYVCSEIESGFPQVVHTGPEEAWYHLSYVSLTPRLVVVHRSEQLLRDSDYESRMKSWLGSKHLSNVTSVFLDSASSWPPKSKSRSSEARALWLGAGTSNTVYVEARRPEASEAAVREFQRALVLAGAPTEAHALSVIQECSEAEQMTDAALRMRLFPKSHLASVPMFCLSPVPDYAQSLALLDVPAALSVADVSDPAAQFPALTRVTLVLARLNDLRRQPNIFTANFSRSLGIPMYLVRRYLAASPSYGHRDTERRISLLNELVEQKDRSSVLTVLAHRW